MIKVPLGPWIVPDKLFNEPCSTTPLKSIRIPDISVDTEALPPMTKEEGSILNAESVSICAFILPCTGPASKAPEPVIV